MYKTKTALLTIALIFLTTTSAFCFGFGTKWMEKYETMKVVDADTGETIEGVWVVVKWERMELTSYINPGGASHKTTKIIELETDKKGEFCPFKSKWKYGSKVWIYAWKKGCKFGVASPPYREHDNERGKWKEEVSPIIKLKKLPEGYEGTEEYLDNMINVELFFEGTKWIKIITKERDRASNLWHKKKG
ncbi:hypothetical protein KKC91_03940 [bacterium]|nr:hypothetical protein [bacterium]